MGSRGVEQVRTERADHITFKSLPSLRFYEPNRSDSNYDKFYMQA